MSKKPDICPHCKRLMPGATPRITPAELRVLNFVAQYIDGNPYAPTYDEISASLQISKCTVFEHLHNMQAKGILSVGRRKARSIEIYWKPDSPDGTTRPTGPLSDVRIEHSRTDGERSLHARAGARRQAGRRRFLGSRTPKPTGSRTGTSASRIKKMKGMKARMLERR